VKILMLSDMKEAANVGIGEGIICTRDGKQTGFGNYREQVV
jgi:hypothetical protein